jgi:acyl carrier protein
MTIEDRITDILLEYAAAAPSARPLDPALSLRDDLAIESLSLVALTLRVGDLIDVDLVQSGIELSGLHTVGDLFQMARRLGLGLEKDQQP